MSTVKSIIALLLDTVFRLAAKVISPLAVLKVGYMEGKRIGDWLPATEFFLRVRAYNVAKINKREWCVFFCNAPCNEQVLTMMRRVLFIIRSDVLTKLVRLIYRYYPNRSYWIQKEFAVPPFADGEIWNNVGSQLGLSAEEIHKGREFEEKLGIQDTSYICFFARDSSYLNDHIAAMDWSYHSYRDWDIEDYTYALEYLSECGIWSLRVGAVVEKEYKAENSKIIDYAWHHRTDFYDVYLMSHCKFFVGDTAGIYFIPQCFGTPFLQLNQVPLNGPTLISTDLFIPKKLYSNKENRYLSFREIFEMGAHTWGFTSMYAEADIIPVSNTQEEILSATQEMNMKLDNTWTETEEDEEMQRVFRSIAGPYSPTIDFHGRIASSFLRRNKGLLG